MIVEVGLVTIRKPKRPSTNAVKNFEMMQTALMQCAACHAGISPKVGERERF